MFFEGSEKKLELVYGGKDLRSVGDQFWTEVVQASGAQILSKKSSKGCDAYLLSESSLFVWKDKFVMITCGETTLVRGVELFLQKMDPAHVQSLIYQRKNEFRPESQATHFEEDLSILKKYFDGKSYSFGKKEGHHLLLFHILSDYVPPTDDVTLEILMYGLQGEAKRLFNCPKEPLELLRAKSGVDKIFEDFIVDDFKFDPCGYSLNAVRDDHYYTIHVTPQDEGAYVSFETNLKIDQNYLPVLKKVVQCFQPIDFDVIVFRLGPQEFIEVEGYGLSSATKQKLACGYNVNHCHFRQGYKSTTQIISSEGAETF